MSAVSAQVLDAAIEWQLCLDSGTVSAEQQHAFAAWLAAHPEHARVWQQLNGLDIRLASAAAAPARHGSSAPVAPRTAPSCGGRARASRRSACGRRS